MEMASLFARHRSIDVIYYKLRCRNSRHPSKEDIRRIIERSLAVWPSQVPGASVEMLMKADPIVKLLCPNVTWKHLCMNAKIQPFQIQMTQPCRTNDASLRRYFCLWASCRLVTDPLFYRQIVFSDEAEFWLNGHVSKHNCYYVSDSDRVNEPPPTRSSAHRQKVTVWCGMHASGIIGPYIYQTTAGDENVSKMIQYRALVSHQLDKFLNVDDEDKTLWFQQDDSPSHAETNDILEDLVGEKFISPGGAVCWPPRSCDLTPMSYFLWGYLKAKVYAKMPKTLDELKIKIHQALATIDRKVLEEVYRHWIGRVHCVLLCCHSHMDEIKLFGNN